jgi:hypothetical protein
MTQYIATRKDNTTFTFFASSLAMARHFALATGEMVKSIAKI